MPRNSGTGIYSQPSNINGVPGAPILSDSWNRKLLDDSSVFNTPWPLGLMPSGLLAHIGGLPLAGGVLTGPLTLSGDATSNLHAATKQQMDAGFATKASLIHAHTVADVTDFSTAAAALIAATSIDALADVVIASPATGQTVRYNGTNWVNSSLMTVVSLGTIAANTTLSAAHGLGSTPRIANFVVRNLVADSNWQPGDEVEISQINLDHQRLVPFRNATQVGVVTNINMNFLIVDKTARFETSFTPARWGVFAYVSL